MSALTAPFDASWSSHLGGALSMPFTVTVVGGPMEVQLEVTSGSVTWDEDSTPHIVASLSCRVPEDQATLDYLDARKGRVLVVEGGYAIPGKRETHVLCALMLTDRMVKRTADGSTMEIKAASAEQLIIDADAPLTGSRSFGPASDGGQAIRDLILWAYPLAEVEVTASGTFVSEGDSLLIDREDKFWSSIQDIADRIGAWVYHDGLGVFRVVPQPVNAAASVAMFNVGVGGTITGSEASLSREGFGNTVVVTYRWFDGEARTATGYAEVTSGDFAVSVIGRKVIPVTIERQGSTAQAQAAAAQMVARAVTRGRSLSVEYEHAPLWVRPGQTVTVALVTGPQERHLVSRVDLDIPSGRGHVTTRQPENVVITTGE